MNEHQAATQVYEEATFKQLVALILDYTQSFPRKKPTKTALIAYLTDLIKQIG